MKRIIIVHGWDFGPERHWYSWLKEKLEGEGHNVLVPQMPDTSHPTIENWVGHLAHIIGSVDGNTYFVGHSMGCQTIMRYLERENKVCGGAVFVAPWFFLDQGVLQSEGQEIVELAEPWLTTPIDFPKVRNNIPKLRAILSSNEPYGCVPQNKDILERELGARVTMKENAGHFTEDDGIVELPEALEEILKLLS